MDSLLSSQDKYRLIFDRINDMIALCDTEYRILESNYSADILLANGESIVGKRCYKIFRCKNEPCADCPLQETFETGTVQPIAVYDERLNEYFEERTYPVLGDDQKLRGFTLVSRNITKTREIEERSALMKKLSALGQISSGVAHDFNNVLTVVLGRVQLLKRQVTDPLLQSSLDMIEKSALDGASKVRKIQEFARPKKDKLTDVIEVKKLLEEVVDITRPKWDDASKIKGIIVEPVLLLEDNIFMMGDSSDLRNAFTNIIFNAADAMPDGGVLTVKSEREGPHLFIEFKDTGTGMTEETIEKIFDPFFTTKGVLGTGLGMSEVYGIVQRHNGKIKVRSVVGRGTSIILRFPIAKRKDVQAQQGPVGDTKSCNILVIDDEEYILEVLNDLLMSMGHTVQVYSSAIEALQQFEKCPVEIVITDLGMPEMNGHEVAERIKDISPLTRLIVISGWALNLNLEEQKNRHFDYIINKPFTIEGVTQTIADAVVAYQAQHESDQ